jgi:hypothetical protein
MRNDKEHDQELDELRKTLQGAVPPVAQPGPQRDLWPRMLRRIEEPPRRVSFRVPWFDWALLGVAAAALLLFPSLIPALLYHL